MTEYTLSSNTLIAIAENSNVDESVNSNIMLVEILGKAFWDVMIDNDNDDGDIQEARSGDIEEVQPYDLAAFFLCFIFDPAKSPEYERKTKIVRQSWKELEFSEDLLNRFGELVGQIVRAYGNSSLSLTFWIDNDLISRLINNLNNNTLIHREE